MEEHLIRIEILHLVTSWSVSCDHGAPVDWVWTEDAIVLAPGGSRIVGKRNIMGRFRGETYSYIPRGEDAPVTTDAPPVKAPSARTEASWLRHNLTTTLIDEVSVETARGLIYFIVLSGDGVIGSGRYEDRYRKVDGAWRIAERTTRLEYIPVGEQWNAARAIAASDRAAEQSLA